MTQDDGRSHGSMIPMQQNAVPGISPAQSELLVASALFDQPQRSNGFDFDPASLFRLLIKRWRLVALSVAACVAIAFVYLLITPKMYSATSVLEIGGYAPVIPGAEIEAAFRHKTEERHYFKTQVAKLTGLSIANVVLSRSDIGETVASYLEGDSSIGSPIDWIRGLFGGSREKEAEPFEHYQFRETLLRKYLRLVSIDPVYDTRLIELSVTTSSPALSWKIANAHGEGFIEHLRSERQQNI